MPWLASQGSAPWSLQLEPEARAALLGVFRDWKRR
jgi:hypothetical protein